MPRHAASPEANRLTLLIPPDRFHTWHALFSEYLNIRGMHDTVGNLLDHLPDSGCALWDCWPWQGRLDDHGYPRFTDGRRLGTNLATRIVWQFVHDVRLRFGVTGEDRIDVDHLCHNPPCVNPLHLDAVSHQVNMDRRRPLTYALHCAKGHELFGPNLYINPRTGQRSCRWCIRMATRKWLDKGDNRERQNRRRGERRCQEM